MKEGGKGGIGGEGKGGGRYVYRGTPRWFVVCRHGLLQVDVVC